MTPAQYCKEAGLSGLKELSELSGQSAQTLTNWFHNKPELFRLVVVGVLGNRMCRVPEIFKEER